jgi:competence protein ComGC
LEAESVVRLRNPKGFTILDALITLCLIGILTGVVIPKYRRMAHEAQESAVKAELTNVRTSISLFKMLNKRNPESLKELIEKKVMLPARTGREPYSTSFFDQKYLNSRAVDSQGNVLDVFGNPFRYDPVRGVVRATTKGFEDW